MIDIIYQEAINNKTQYHSEQIGRLKELNNRKPEWSEPKKLFKKKHGKTRFEAFGVPTGTIGVYRIIYEPTGERDIVVGKKNNQVIGVANLWGPWAINLSEKVDTLPPSPIGR